MMNSRLRTRQINMEIPTTQEKFRRTTSHQALMSWLSRNEWKLARSWAPTSDSNCSARRTSRQSIMHKENPMDETCKDWNKDQVQSSDQRAAKSYRVSLNRNSLEPTVPWGPHRIRHQIPRTSHIPFSKWHHRHRKDVVSTATSCTSTSRSKVGVLKGRRITSIWKTRIIKGTRA